MTFFGRPWRRNPAWNGWDVVVRWAAAALAFLDFCVATNVRNDRITVALTLVLLCVAHAAWTGLPRVPSRAVPPHPAPKSSQAPPPKPSPPTPPPGPDSPYRESPPIPPTPPDPPADPSPPPRARLTYMRAVLGLFIGLHFVFVLAVVAIIAFAIESCGAH